MIRNEQLKLLATTLNNLGLAFLIGGFVGPTLTGQFRSWWIIAWIAAGFGLHACAQFALRGLKE
ncbi:MAG: hypothetical protein FWD12_00720 [Alphaproteobacteria bacterium]|nr:hypothetical protein [Alphaproteobacteria bacterium]